MNIKRILPGVALRVERTGEIPFYKGVLTYASERIQYVVLEHPEHKLVFLIGETYAFYCEPCKKTLWQQELQAHMRQGWYHCPFCQQRVRALKPGEKVRVHYRYSKDGSSGMWWAELWEF